jgi:hypothetical protein
MKKTVSTMTNLLAALTFMVSCQRDNLCEGDDSQQVETFYEDELSATLCSLLNTDSPKKMVNLVITSQTDFEKYVGCGAQTPAIDFEKYFILTGMYRHHQCARFDNQQVLLCNSKIVYRVRILEQDCHAPTSVFYVAVVERKYDNLNVVFDVQFKN